MPKVSECVGESDRLTGWTIDCPACEYGHLFDKRWTFNGDSERPTFAPSMLVRSVKLPDRDPATGEFARGPDGKYLLDEQGRLLGTKDTVCHSFVRDGHIEFLGDCTHVMAGQTVDLPEI